MERCTLARTPSMSWPCHPAKLAHLACFARRTARDLTMSRFLTVSRFRAFDRRSRSLDLRLAVPKHPFSRSSLGWSNRQYPELACGIIHYTRISTRSRSASSHTHHRRRLRSSTEHSPPLPQRAELSRRPRPMTIQSLSPSCDASLAPSRASVPRRATGRARRSSSLSSSATTRPPCQCSRVPGFPLRVFVHEEARETLQSCYTEHDL